MVELVVLMAVVGVLAVMVLPKFDAIGALDAVGYADQSKALLRYAQKSAVAQRRWVAVDFGAAPPTLCSQPYTAPPVCGGTCSGGAALDLPAGGVRTPQASTTRAGFTVLCFDAVGRPYAAGANTPMSVAATVTVSDAGVVIRSIVVAPETGYVQ